MAPTDITIIRPRSRDEWLAARTNGIGSSEIATIVGLNPWETPYQLWRRKRGIDPAKEENFAMRAGHYLEDAVARFWSDATGRSVIKRSATDWIIQSKSKPFLQVSPDRTYWLNGMPHSAGNKGILECKTTQKSIDPDDIPQHWFCQVQYQLGTAQLSHGSLAWLCSGREFGYTDIALVPDFYSWLVDEAERFWTDNVVGGHEPAATAVPDILLKFGRHTDGKSVEVSDDIAADCAALRDLRDKIDQLTLRREELEARIKLAFADAESVTYNGQTLATWRSPKPSMLFDAKSFQADHPDLAAQYTREVSGARRFVLK